MPPPQVIMVAAGQLPSAAPLQVASLVTTPMLHDCRRHPLAIEPGPPNRRQRPVPVAVVEPLHRPSKPHARVSAVALHMPDGSVAPLARSVQVPTLFVALHVSHAPEQAVLQHTPSRVSHVRPDVHWLLAVHGPPAGCRPHEPLTQVLGDTQLLSLVHVRGHEAGVVELPATHRKLPHVLFVVMQAPLLLQAGTATDEVVAHVAVPHESPMARTPQLPPA